MSRQFKGTLYYLFADVRYTLTVFWIILIIIAGLLITIQTIFPGEENEIAFSISFPIIIFASVIGFLTVKKSIPYMVRIGATRNCVYVSVFIFFVCLTLFNAVLAFLINLTITVISGKEVVQGFIISSETGQFSIKHLAQFLGDSPFYQIIVDGSIALFMAVTMFLIGLVFYRFQLIGGFIFLGSGFVAFILSAVGGWIEKIFVYIFENYNLMIYGNLLALSVFIYLISYLLIKRIAV